MEKLKRNFPYIAALIVIGVIIGTVTGDYTYVNPAIAVGAFLVGWFGEKKK